MSGQLLSSKIVVVEEEPRVRGIPSAPTSIAGAVGIAERGPIAEPVLCTSFEDYQRAFGGFTQNSDLALAALGFFQNGGTHLWVVRTVHFADVAEPSTATAVRGAGYLVAGGGPAPASATSALPAPFVLAPGDALVLAVGGGPDQTLVVEAAPAFVTASGPGPYALADGQTLTVRVDGGPLQTLLVSAGDFADVGAATADEVVAALNAQLVGGKALRGVPRLQSDTRGTASRLEVTGGTANAALGFPTAPALGTGNVQSVRAVTAEELLALTAVAFEGVAFSADPDGFVTVRTLATGAAAALHVKPPTAAAFGFPTTPRSGSDAAPQNAVRVEGKDPGSYANRLLLEVRRAASGKPAEFDLLVVEGGAVVETFPNLSLAPSEPRYVEKVVNDPASGSSRIRVTDQLLPGPVVPPPQTATLAGGDDGLLGLDDADFLGSDAGRTGLRALDRVLDLALLFVPGRATPAVHNGMLAYGEVDRAGTVFSVLDPPAGLSAAEIVTYVESTASLLNLSEYGAIYWPRLTILNPKRSVFGPGDRVVVPPSGVVCGVIARGDAARPGGVYEAPAGAENGRMVNVLGFETDEVLEERKRDLVYPKRINPLTSGPGLPRFVDGSRTLKGDGNFPYVGERRGTIFIQRSLKQGLEFARHKNNTEGLRATVRRTITVFLLAQMNVGAFRSRDPQKAFFVDVSDALNPPSVVFAGQLVVRVGLATNKPAEFIILNFSQDTRAIESELLAAAGGG
ncbi:MAG TPA: hypothetical protein VFS43_09400 [Polyangiaceae bacterium]|nr:hypothetical protein [Polyangiaceae bacterium]